MGRARGTAMFGRKAKQPEGEGKRKRDTNAFGIGGDDNPMQVSVQPHTLPHSFPP